MSELSTPILTLTKNAAGAITAQRFVTHARLQAGAASNTLGVARYGVAQGVDVPIDVLGTTTVDAGAAIADGALLETDASGRAITRAAGPIVGRALEAAAALGDKIEILLIAN
jgi:Uncharacterized conserved protein (DUF2190)